VSQNDRLLGEGVKVSLDFEFEDRSSRFRFP
jgi:hypothetical protein